MAKQGINKGGGPSGGSVAAQAATENLLGQNVNNFDSPLFHKNLEAFLFDMDIPHLKIFSDVSEFYNSNILRELKKNNNTLFEEFKGELIKLLKEYERTQSNLNYIMNKSVF